MERRSSPQTHGPSHPGVAEPARVAWISDALRADVVHRSLRVAAVVGSLLVLINQGDRLIGGEMSTGGWLKVALTYLVPYAVSTYAAVGAIRGARDR